MRSQKVLIIEANLQIFQLLFIMDDSRLNEKIFCKNGIPCDGGGEG